MRKLLMAAVAGISFPVAAAAAPLSDTEADALLRSVDTRAPQLESVARDIWSYAEVGFKEHKSSARLQKELKEAGFKVEAGIDGMPTAFVATAGSGGPVIALLAEFDALPGLAQRDTAQRQPIAGQIAGHACGHNLLGAASVSAAIAIKQWLSRTGVAGTIRIYGTPAEEGGFAKVYLARDGYFKDVDVTLTWHPGASNDATQGRSLAMVSGKFRFEGVAAHAAAAPERGRSALDGVEVMDVATNFLREHVPSDTRIHYVITKGGDQPNIVPASAESFYYVRHHDSAVVKDVWARVVNAAQGAALATGTKVNVELISGTYSTLPNDVLGRIVYGNLKRVGGVTYSPQEAEFARAIQSSYGDQKFRVTDPAQVQPYGAERDGSASSDVGDISWVTPTVGLSTATWVSGTSAHSWQAAATSGTGIGVKGAVVAAKTLTLTAAELFRSPDDISAAKAEFEQRRGDGYRYTSFIGDRKPPLDYTDH